MTTEKDINVLEIDAKNLQTLLEKGTVTSLDLVRQYVAQIQRHDDKLHAMIRTTPIEILEDTAKSLDQERAAGKIRGPLHGIPITIKVRQGPDGCDRAEATLLISFPRTILPLIQILDSRLVQGVLLS